MAYGIATVTEERNVELWLVSADDDDGTWAAAFATETEAYDHIFGCIGKTRDDFNASKSDIWDFINANVVNAGMDTYNVTYDEVALPALSYAQSYAIQCARMHLQDPAGYNEPKPWQLNELLDMLGQKVESPALLGFYVRLNVADIQVEDKALSDAKTNAIDDLRDPALAHNWNYRPDVWEDLGEPVEKTHFYYGLDHMDTVDGEISTFTFMGYVHVKLMAATPAQAMVKAVEFAKARS